MYKVEAKLEYEKNVSSFTAFKEEEKTTVLCTVDGPFHLPTRNEDLEALTVDVKWKGQDLKEEKYNARLIKSILDEFIIKNLDASKGLCVCLFVTGSSKWSLICGLNAALLGLVRCGIPLRSMFYAVTQQDVVYVFDDDKMVNYHFMGILQHGELPVCSEYKLNYTKEVIRFSIRDQHTI